jgi:hypothetical protein
MIDTTEHRPGTIVQVSGIYQVLHDRGQHPTGHATYHEVTCVRGDEFPPCRAKGCKPSFRLAKEAKHLKEDPFLERR